MDATTIVVLIQTLGPLVIPLIANAITWLFNKSISLLSKPHQDLISPFLPVVAGTIYDPTRLLAPSGGLTELLTSAQQARTEEREGVDGADAFRVTAVLEGKVLGPLVPNSVPPRVPATLWIGAAHPFLLKAETSLPRGASSEATAITLTISDFNLPVEVTPPSTS